MKIKTTVTLSEDLLHALASWPESAQNRSAFLETAAWAYLARIRREQINAHDLAIINHRTDYLNAEIADALIYQISILKPASLFEN